MSDIDKEEYQSSDAPLLDSFGGALKKLIAKQLREEYRELIPSSIVMEANYHFLYIVDENLNFILFENEEN